MVVKSRISILTILFLCVCALASSVVEDSRSRFVLDDEVIETSVHGCIDELGSVISGSRFFPENSTKLDSSDVPVRIYRVALPAGASPRISLSVKKTVPLSKSYCEGANLRFMPVRASEPFFRDGLWMMDVYVPLYEKWGSSVKLRQRFRLEIDFSVSGSGVHPGKRALSRVVNPLGAKSFGVSRNSLRRSLRKLAKSETSDVHFLAKFLVGSRNQANVGSHSEDGLYAVDYRTILKALPQSRQGDLVGIPVEKIRLYGASPDTLPAVVPGAAGIAPSHLAEIPIEVRDHSENGRGSADGTFNDGDTIVFVGYGTSTWKFADSSYYHSTSPYSFYQYFQFGWSETGKGLRMDSPLAYSGSAKEVPLMRYVRAEKDEKLRDAYFGKGLDWDEATGKEWFWLWHSRKDSVTVPSSILPYSEFVMPQMERLPGRKAGGRTLLQVSYIPHRSVNDSYVEQMDDQVHDLSLSFRDMPERMSAIRFNFAVNGNKYADSDMKVVAYGTMQVEGVPLKDSGNDYSLTMLPNARQYDRFDGYTVAYEWTPVVDTAEWYLPGRISGLVKLPVPSGASLMKFVNMVPVGLLKVSGGYAVDSANGSDDVRYLAFRDGAYRQTISVEAISEISSDVLSDIAKINSKTEYLILSPQEFLDGAVALGKFRSEGSAVSSFATTVVNVEDVYRAYTGGSASPVALRNYIAYAYSVCPDLKYVLLLGSGHYDYRGIKSKLGPNYIPPFELEDNVTEDFFAVLDSGEFVRYGLYDIDVAVGRVSVGSPLELASYIEKAKDYDLVGRYDHSTWRSTLLFAADDAKNGSSVDKNGHTASQETLAKTVDAITQSMNYRWNQKKVYLLDYEEDAAGQKRAATEDLLNIINQGALITSYFGHGSKTDWAGEGLLKPSYMPRLSNKSRYTILNSYACVVGRFDDGAAKSLSEEFVLADQTGSIASIGAARETFASFNENIARNFLFDLLSGSGTTLGEAMVRAKNIDAEAVKTISLKDTTFRQRYNNEQYILFGEPVIQMPIADFKVSLDQNLDTLKALDKVKLSGSVSGMENGLIEISLRESAVNKKLYVGYDTKNDSLDVKYDGMLVYSEKVPVSLGRFETEFISPRKMSFGDTAAEFSAWAYSNDERAIGRYRMGGIAISGFSTYADSINDTIPPSISIKNCYTSGAETSYADGQTVRMQSPACLQVEVEDSTALDFREYADEGLSFEVDGMENPYHPYPYLEQSSKHAVVRKTFTQEAFPEGNYVFRVSALDVLGNVAKKTINIEITGDMKEGLADVFNAPNPMGKKGTTFYFKNLALNRESTVNIFIYNQHGRLVKVLKDAVSGVTHWDGRDNHGRLLANGLYHYVVRSEISATDNFKSKTWTKKQKLLISR